MESLKLKIDKLEERIAPTLSLGLGAITSVNLGFVAGIGVEGGGAGDCGSTNNDCCNTCSHSC